MTLPLLGMQTLNTPSKGGGGGPTYSAEALAYFARLTTPPSDARKLLYDNLIAALKTAGVWAKLDALLITAAADNQAARQNLVQDAYHLTAVSSPTFLADRGYTGDGASNYLSNTFNPATAPSPKFVRDDAHFGVWTGTEVSGSVLYDAGALNSRINSKASTVAQIAANDAASNRDMGLASSIGWTCWSRSLATEFDVVRGLDTPRNFSSSSVALPSLPFFLCAYANTGSVAAGFSSRRQQALHWGSSLNDTERDAFYAALNTYMTAIGAA